MSMLFWTAGRGIPPTGIHSRGRPQKYLSIVRVQVIFVDPVILRIFNVDLELLQVDGDLAHFPEQVNPNDDVIRSWRVWRRVGSHKELVQVASSSKGQ